MPLPPDTVLEHIIDVHCHPTDSMPITADSLERLQITICAMSTRHGDQALVRGLAESQPNKVIPCFGHHPWFSHTISLSGLAKEVHYRRLFLGGSEENNPAFEQLLPHLPDPVPLESVLSDLKNNLEAFPNAMLGEVGVDRVFRVPLDYFASPRELTPFTIPIEHQIAILEAQLELAVELQRNISFHAVKTQQATFQLFEKMSAKYGERWLNISVDMHSCTISAQMWRDMEKKHPNLFLSLSTVINSRSENHIALIKACRPDRILVESDFDHIDSCTERTWSMVETIAAVKGWQLETEWTTEAGEQDSWGVVRRLEQNWKLFSEGNHKSALKKRKKVVDWQSDGGTDEED